MDRGQAPYLVSIHLPLPPTLFAMKNDICVLMQSFYKENIVKWRHENLGGEATDFDLFCYTMKTSFSLTQFANNPCCFLNWHEHPQTTMHPRLSFFQ